MYSFIQLPNPTGDFGGTGFRHQIQTRARAVQQGRQAKEQAGQCAGSVRREGEAVVRAGDRAEEMRGSG